MCTFITLVALGGSRKKLDAFANAHGRHIEEMSNPSVAKLLISGEQQFLLIKSSSCDCGTVLGSADPTSDEVAAQRQKEHDRLARKGWSETKIARAFADREHASDRTPANREDIPYWADIVRGLLAREMLRSAGLLIHNYHGEVGSESIRATRRNIQLDDQIERRLTTLREDELLVFSR
jgi:hypothetical protein